MVVCMSRRICVDLYEELVLLRPEWHSEDDTQGQVKIVMTGSASDPLEWQGHIRNKGKREALAKRFRDAQDRSRWCLFVTCGSPDLMRQACIPCMWTSRCAGMVSCRPLPV